MVFTRTFYLSLSWARWCGPCPPPTMFFIHCNTVYPFMPCSSKCSLSFWFSHKTFSHFSSPAYKPHSRTHFLHWDLITVVMIGNIWWGIQIMQFLIIQFSLVFCFCHHLMVNYCFSTLFSYTLSLCSSFNVREQFLHTHTDPAITAPI